MVHGVSYDRTELVTRHVIGMAHTWVGARLETPGYGISIDACGGDTKTKHDVRGIRNGTSRRPHLLCTTTITTTRPASWATDGRSFS